MITTKLFGGMANQMFQYALGRHLALIHKTELMLDISWFDYAPQSPIRKYDLHHFNINAAIAPKQEINKNIKAPQNRLNYLFSRLLIRLNLFQGLNINEQHFHFNPAVLNAPNNVFINGNWQSEKYFKNIEKIIKNDLTLKTAPNQLNQDILSKINNSDQTVSIHIRRGDYIHHKSKNQFHGVCSVDYYKKAVEILNSKLENPFFYIFSDDISWCRENLDFIDSKFFVDINDDNTNYEDLRLMSNCKHNIIANSSYSWWGAWLNNNPEKIVISPQKWFYSTKTNTKDLIPEKWIKL